MLLSQRVLVRWIPGPLTRQRRKAVMGVEYASEVQQKAISIYDPAFSEAAALAETTPEGTLILNVGWRGTAVYAVGWIFDGIPSPTGGRKEVLRFDLQGETPDALTPSNDVLIKAAWDDRLLAIVNGRERSTERARLQADAQAYADDVKRQLDAAKARTDAEMSNLPAHPFFDADAWERASVPVQTGAGDYQPPQARPDPGEPTPGAPQQVDGPK